jgi:hypothetical protein
MGEVGVYAERVITEIERYRRSRPRASTPPGRGEPAAAAGGHKLRRLLPDVERALTRRRR